MALSITANSFEYTVFGNRSVVIADLALSGTYEEGGAVLPFETLFGLHSVDMVLSDQSRGFSFKYDNPNEKLKLFNPRAPLIVYDEHHVVDASYQCKLNYPAAFLMNVAAPGQNLKLRSTGVTPGSNQCSLAAQLSEGVRPTLTVTPGDILVGGTFAQSAALAIGSTKPNVAQGAFTFWIAGVEYTKTADAVGTAPGNDVVPDGKFGAVAVDIDSSGTIAIVEAADNATGYNTAALAIAGIAAVGAGYCRLGWVTAKDTGAAFTFGTTDLDHAGATVAFTNNTLGWTMGTGWAKGSGVVNKSADGTGTLSERNFAAVIGETYEITYVISNWTVGSVTPTVGGTAGTAVGADGTYTERIVATTTGGILFTPTDTSRFTIDTISCKCVTAKVTYVTQAWKDVWDNLVQDEVVTLATGNNTLATGNKILAVMYVDQITATAAALTMVDESDTTASGEIRPMFNVATAQLNCHSGQNGKVVKMTYLKVPSSGFLKNRCFNNEAATNSGGDPYLNTFNYPILLWGYAGCAPVDTGVTQVLIDYAGTPGAGEAVVDYFTPGARGAGAPAVGTVIGVKSNVTLTGAGIWGVINEVPGAQPLEMRDGESLSISSVKVIIIGT